MGTKTTEKRTIFDPLCQMPENQPKRTTEKELHRSYGGQKASKRDLRTLVKTVWALNDSITVLSGAIGRLTDEIEQILLKQ